ncbi:unnamed protein product [Musa acuminata var. zebrina]
MSSSSSPPTSSRSVSKISSSGSGSCRVEVTSSSSGGSSSMDSKAFANLLGPIQDCYSIPKDYELRAPCSGQRPYDLFPNGFELTTDTLEVGLRFPLHPVIRECLRWWGISLS